MMLYKSSLYPFIVLAVGVHIALGLTLFQSESQLLTPSQNSNGISVTLTNNTISIQAKKSRSTQENEEAPSNINNGQKHKTNKNIQPKVQKKQNDANDSVADIEQKNTESLVKLISTIQEQIKHNFYYPRIAQIRNWEGTVILSLNIEKNGKIKNIFISSSSGHDVLDNAALEAINKIKIINFQKNIIAQKQTIHLPVTYQLTEG